MTAGSNQLYCKSCPSVRAAWSTITQHSLTRTRTLLCGPFSGADRDKLAVCLEVFGLEFVKETRPKLLSALHISDYHYVRLSSAHL